MYPNSDSSSAVCCEQSRVFPWLVFPFSEPLRKPFHTFVPSARALAVFHGGMKTSVLLLFFLASLTAATAQSPLELNLATTAGEPFPVDAGKLTLLNAWLTSVSANGARPILARAVGPVTFTTPEFSSGSVAAGGSFSAGGQFFITLALGRRRQCDLCQWHLGAQGAPQRLRPTMFSLRRSRARSTMKG